MIKSFLYCFVFLMPFFLSEASPPEAKQEIKRQSKREELAMLSLAKQALNPIGIITINNPPFFYPGTPPSPFSIGLVNLSLKNNLPAEWRIMQGGMMIYRGRGNVSNAYIPAGRNYYITVEPIPGYSAYISPRGFFDAEVGRPVQAEIYYQRDAGTLTIETIVPSAEPLSVTIYPEDPSQTPIKAKLTPEHGRVHWMSSSLPTGNYKVSYQTSGAFLAPPDERFTVIKGDNVLLSPQFNPKGSLNVSTDTAQAIFTLSDMNGNVVGQGQGPNYVFSNLDPGTYTVTFSSSSAQIPTLPPPQQVEIAGNQHARVNANYSQAGRLTINSNIDHFFINIQPLNSSRSAYQEEIKSRSQTLQLPEGRYLISSQPLNAGDSPPQSIEVNIKPFLSQSIYLPHEKAIAKREERKVATTRRPIPRQTAPKPTLPPTNQSGMLIITNLSNSSFTVENVTDQNPKLVGKFKGKSVFVPVDKQGSFRISFDPAPNYHAPNPVTIELAAEEQKQVEVAYQPGDSFVNVPAGEAVIGDPFNDRKQNERPARTVYISEFEIGVYEVTNQQFADWLNRAFEEKKVSWHPSLQGHLVDQEGFLICRTMEGNPLAQILTQRGGNNPFFSPLPGRENYPVIEVSWYGANAYCRDNGYRLPKENEWEKAAGMAIPASPNELPKRFKYGFGRDTIDRSWANYKDPQYDTGSTQVVLTTPVGFYNGSNTLPLTIHDRAQVVTHHATSPAGAYDMSGNVWEWVASWDELDPSDTKKIAKGGSYDSLADGLRVSERIALPLEHADIYTGFRAAQTTGEPPSP